MKGTRLINKLSKKFSFGPENGTPSLLLICCKNFLQILHNEKEIGQ